jgi:phosphomevalonate kinase
MIATAPGKLIIAGEYAVLDGAPALVLAVDRRVIATRRRGPRGSSPFLIGVVNELDKRLGSDHAAARAALEVVVDSAAFYAGGTKLGLGSSAAVTVAATALALAADHEAVPLIDRELVLSIASAAHGAAQSAQRGRRSTAEIRPAGDAKIGRGSDPDLIAHQSGWDRGRGSGADIAAAVYGGVIAFQRETPDRVAWPSDAAAHGRAITIIEGATIDRLAWPAGVTLIPFYTGAPADTRSLVAAVATARDADRRAVDAALLAIDKAARAACQACAARIPEIASNALLSALALAAHAMDQLASATGLPLVPSSVTAARGAMSRLGGTAKTTGAGGGDIAIAVIPGTEDVTAARRYLIEVGCQPLRLSVDTTGVDLQPDAQ